MSARERPSHTPPLLRRASLPLSAGGGRSSNGDDPHAQSTILPPAAVETAAARAAVPAAAAYPPQQLYPRRRRSTHRRSMRSSSRHSRSSSSPAEVVRTRPRRTRTRRRGSSRGAPATVVPRPTTPVGCPCHGAGARDWRAPATSASRQSPTRRARGCGRPCAGRAAFRWKECNVQLMRHPTKPKWGVYIMDKDGAAERICSASATTTPRAADSSDALRARRQSRASRLRPRSSLGDRGDSLETMQHLWRRALCGDIAARPTLVAASGRGSVVQRGQHAAAARGCPSTTPVRDAPAPPHGPTRGQHPTDAGQGALSAAVWAAGCNVRVDIAWARRGVRPARRVRALEHVATGTVACQPPAQHQSQDRAAKAVAGGPRSDRGADRAGAPRDGAGGQPLRSDAHRGSASPADRRGRASSRARRRRAKPGAWPGARRRRRPRA